MSIGNTNGNGNKRSNFAWQNAMLRKKETCCEPDLGGPPPPVTEYCVYTTSVFIAGGLGLLNGQSYGAVVESGDGSSIANFLQTQVNVQAGAGFSTAPNSINMWAFFEFGMEPLDWEWTPDLFAPVPEPVIWTLDETVSCPAVLQCYQTNEIIWNLPGGTPTDYSPTVIGGYDTNVPGSTPYDDPATLTYLETKLKQFFGPLVGITIDNSGGRTVVTITDIYPFINNIVSINLNSFVDQNEIFNPIPCP